MKKFVLIVLISFVFTQCSWIANQRLQMPPTLTNTKLHASLKFPLITPQVKRMLPANTKTYTITFKPFHQQTHEQTFTVQWESDNQLDVVPAFLKDIAAGESLPVHGVVVHKVSITTSTGAIFELSFAVSKTGTQSLSKSGLSQETIFQHIFPSTLTILQNAQPVGKITIRDVGVSDIKTDVMMNGRVWNTTMQSILNQTRFLIQDSEGPMAFFVLKPAKKLISSTDEGEIYFRSETPVDDQSIAVLAYIYSYALFWANDHV